MKMKVIHTTDLSREGNDCWIAERVSLIKELGLYNVILTTKVSGYWDIQTMTTLDKPVDNLKEALKAYKIAGGQYNGNYTYDSLEEEIEGEE